MATLRPSPALIRASLKHDKVGHSATVRKEPVFTYQFLLVSGLLVVITWLVFGQTIAHDFVNFDDHVYVYDNPLITKGITLKGLIAAFTHPHARNWHPLTTISHMLDCQLFGLKAGGHHFSNVLLHTVAVLLLFAVLREMTGTLWRSAFVAAVFATHPLHVESVAWVAERKDVLSAVFFMLTLGAYVRYVCAPSIARYLSVAALFALGLMSKPMLVTLPFVLLLLDYWPLKRGQPSGVRGQKSKISNAGSTITKLILEKIPLFALSAISCAVTLLAQKQNAGSIDQLPFMWRLNNAFVSYVDYIWEMFWPTRLAVFYPHPNNRLPVWEIILAIAFLLAVTAAALVLRKKMQYVLTGWFWFLGMLMPVMGFVQVGEQARADRYTYLPQIGLYLLIVWAITDLMAFWKGRRAFFAVATPMIIAALSWCAFLQTSYWKSSERLWTHALAVTSGNDVAHNNLGFLFLRRGELDNAISHFQTALNIRSTNAETHYNLGAALIHNNLGNALARKGLADDAITHYQEAVKLRPDYADAYYNFGSVLLQEGRIDEAITQWQKALAIQPNDGEVYTSLGNALLQKGSVKEAIDHYQQAVQIAPQDPLSRHNLAWVLATSADPSIRNGPKAVVLAEQAVQLSGGTNPTFFRTLAAAYAESRRFPEAIGAAERGMEMATEQGKSGLANALKSEIALYRAHAPRRETSPIH
jgi:tetratricopeptide (TPR) repeat protein